MSNKILLIFLFLFFFIDLFGQNKQPFIIWPQKDRKLLDFSYDYSYYQYTTISVLSPSIACPQNTIKEIDISFPYTTTNSAGIVTSYDFYGKINNPVPNNFFLLNILEIERGVQHFFLNGNTAVDLKGSFTGSVGFGVNLFLDNKVKLGERNLVLKPSLNIAYYQLVTGDFGIIDNSNLTVRCLGREEDPYVSFHNRARNGYNQYPTQNLVFNYEINEWGLQPKISLSNNPFLNSIHVELFASYFMPITDYEGIRIKQDFSGGSFKSSDLIPLNSSGLTSNYNNQSVHSKIHTSLANFSFGIKFGFTSITIANQKSRLF